MGLLLALVCEKPMRSFISTLMVASRLYRFDHDTEGPYELWGRGIDDDKNIILKGAHVLKGALGPGQTRRERSLRSVLIEKCRAV
jgi:hypothetical protein